MLPGQGTGWGCESTHEGEAVFLGQTQLPTPLSSAAQKAHLTFCALGYEDSGQAQAGLRQEPAGKEMGCLGRRS